MQFVLLEDILTDNLDIIPKYSKISLVENIEKKKKYILKQLDDYDNAEEIIKWIAKADPVSVKSGGKKTPFVNDILNWFLNGKIRLPEDIETTREALTIYNNAKQQGQTKPVSEYGSPGEIRREHESESDDPNDYGNIAELVAQDGEYKMYRIDDYDQGKICFADSGWCVKDEEHFDEYDPPFYMVTKGKKRYALLHKDSYSAKDVYDDSLTMDLAKPIEKFIKKVWPKFEYKDDLINVSRLWPEAEPAIMKNPKRAFYHARYVIKDRWPEAEPIIMKDPELAFYYAEDVIKGRWPEAEPYIMKDPRWAYYYARYVIKDRWPEAELYIMKDPKWASYYTKYVIKDR